MKAARLAEMNAFVGLHILNQFENQTLGNP